MEINITPVRMFCPNCGKLITGFVGDDGLVKWKCDRCRVVLLSRHHSRYGDTDIKMKYPR